MKWIKFNTIQPERPFDQVLVGLMELSANHNAQLRSMHGALIAMVRALAADRPEPQSQALAEALARLDQAEAVMAEYEAKSLEVGEALASKLQAAAQPRPPGLIAATTRRQGHGETGQEDLRGRDRTDAWRTGSPAALGQAVGPPRHRRVRRARRAPARAARSRRSPSGSARASFASSRCRRRPSARRSQMYMQRYMPHFPAAGEIVIFDRSWYNRAGVEHVMGFCTEEQVRALSAASARVEKVIVDVRHHPDEILAGGQRRGAGRAASRRGSTTRCKLWKLSPMDLSPTAAGTTTRGRATRCSRRPTPPAPWHVVRSDDKQRARLNCIRHLLRLIPYKKVQSSEGEAARPQGWARYLPADHPLRYVPDRWAEG